MISPAQDVEKFNFRSKKLAQDHTGSIGLSQDIF